MTGHAGEDSRIRAEPLRDRPERTPAIGCGDFGEEYLLRESKKARKRQADTVTSKSAQAGLATSIYHGKRTDQNHRLFFSLSSPRR